MAEHSWKRWEKRARDYRVTCPDCGTLLADGQREKRGGDFGSSKPDARIVSFVFPWLKLNPEHKRRKSGLKFAQATLDQARSGGSPGGMDVAHFEESRQDGSRDCFRAVFLRYEDWIEWWAAVHLELHKAKGCAR